MELHGKTAAVFGLLLVTLVMHCTALPNTALLDLKCTGPWPGYGDCAPRAQWLSENWQNDPKYAEAGVDGSPCSIQKYLFQENKWCPDPDFRYADDIVKNPDGSITFQVYTAVPAQSAESGRLENINAWNIPGVLRQLHTQIAPNPDKTQCLRSGAVSQIYVHKVTVKNVAEFETPEYEGFGPLLQFRGGACVQPDNCEEILSEHGGFVGRAIIETSPDAGYDHSVTYSFPRAGTQCEQAPSGTKDCTYQYEALGSIQIDEFVNLPNGDFHSFCKAGGVEFATTPGEPCSVEKSIDFWVSPCDKAVCSSRTQALMQYQYDVEPDVPTKIDGKAFNFITIGDWGRNADGSSITQIPRFDPPGSPEWKRDFYAQENVRDHMTEQARQLKPQIVLNVGDSFYWRGVERATDQRFQETFENVYSDASLQVPWFSILGNHDIGGGDCMYGYGGPFGNPWAQIGYTRKSRHWYMPARYFDHSIQLDDFDVALFFLDTNLATDKTCNQKYCQSKVDPADVDRCKSDMRALFREQLAWLTERLEQSDAVWKVVVGHHPIEYYAGPQKSALHDLFTKHNVQLYYCGHAHLLSHSVFNNKTHHFISGSGGGMQEIGYTEPQQVWSYVGYGFMTSSMDKDQVVNDFFTASGRKAYRTTVKRDGSYTVERS